MNFQLITSSPFEPSPFLPLSLDWFKGKSTGKPTIGGTVFPVSPIDFPTNLLTNRYPTLTMNMLPSKAVTS